MPISSHRLSHHPAFPFVVWGCAAIFFCFQFLVRVSPSVMAKDIMASWHLCAADLGFIMSFYYMGYTAMQIPVGLIFDRFGVRRPLAFACALLGTGCFLFGYVNSIWIMALARLLIGIGSAFGLLSAVKAASLWFTPQRFTMMVGLTLMVGMIGATGGNAPLSLLVEALGWQQATLFLAVFGFTWAFVVTVVVKDRRHNLHIQEEAPLSLRQALWALLKNPQTYVFGLYGMTMYTILPGFADLWGASFIAKLYNVDSTTAALVISMFYVGVGVGGPTFAWFADCFCSHKWVMAGGAAICLVLTTIMIYVPFFPIWGAYLMFWLIGFFSAAQFLGYAGVSAINHSSISASASGVHNMMCMVSGIWLLPLHGKLIDWSWVKTGSISAQGVRLYEIADYHLSFAPIPICLVIAILLAALCMHETYPGRQREGK